MATDIDLRTELYYSGAWNNVQSYTYERDRVRVARGTQNESAIADPSSIQFTLNNRDGRFSPRNPTSPLYGLVGRNTPARVTAAPRLAAFLGLVCNMQSTNTPASTPDNAALDITGDIDLRAELRLLSRDTTSATACLLTKGTVSASVVGTQFSYGLWFGYNTAGTPHLTFRWSTNGTTVQFVDQNISLPYGRKMAVRATLDVNDGAGNKVITFYTSDTIGGTWTSAGSTTTAGTTSIFSGSGTLVAGVNGTLDPFHGVLSALEVRSSIGGTAVANPVFSSQSEGASSFADAAGRTWTVGTGGRIGYAPYPRAIGEVASLPQTWDQSGTDVYVPLTAAGITRRLGQGQKAKSLVPLAEFVKNKRTGACWPGLTAADRDPTGPPLTQVGQAGVTFGTGDLGTGQLGMTVPDTTLVRDANGYMQSGYVNGNVGVYAMTAWQLCFQFKSDAMGQLAFVVTDYNQTQPTEYEILLRGNASDVAVIQRTNNYDTGVVSQTLLGRATSTAVSDGGLHTGQMTIADAGGGNVSWFGIIDGAIVISGTTTGTMANVNDVHMGYFANTSQSTVRVSYVTVFADSDVIPYADWGVAGAGYLGETAGDRLSRLCSENSIPFRIVGDPDDTMPMGPQGQGDLLSLLRDCATADMGYLRDTMDELGLTYTTRSALYSQSAGITLDYSTNVLSAPPNPVDDDQATRNDITVSNWTGGSVEATLDSGRLSTQAPPNGVNTYATSASVTVQTDALLDNIAGWLLAKGTLDESRFPAFSMQVRNGRVWASASLLESLLSLDVTELLVLTDLPGGMGGPEDVRQLVFGLTETWDQFDGQFSWNTTPASLYDIDVFEDGRFSPENSTLGADRTTTQTSWSLVSAANTELWTTDAGDFPFDLMVAGEQVTVSTISGSSSPQTATVVRSVNGVVKAQTAGTPIQLYQPGHYGL